MNDFLVACCVLAAVGGLEIGLATFRGGKNTRHLLAQSCVTLAALKRETWEGGFQPARIFQRTLKSKLVEICNGEHIIVLDFDGVSPLVLQALADRMMVKLQDEVCEEK